MSGAAIEEGVEEHVLGATVVRVFSLAKTVADCFKFRTAVGTDVALEALREAVTSRRVSAAELMHHARVVRVSRIVRPHLEAIR